MSRFLRATSVFTVTVLFALGVNPAAQALSANVTSLTGFHNPAGVAFSLDGTLAYIVENDDGTMGGESAVSVIDSRTLENLSGRISAGQVGAGSNQSIAMSPDGTKAYVSLGGGQVKPFYPATSTFGPAIAVGSTGIGQVVFTPDGTKAYVAVANNGGGNVVKVIDVSTDSVMATITVGGGPNGIAVTPDGLKVFVNCADGSVWVIETVGNTVVTTFTPAGHGQGTMITMAPDGSTVWITAFGGGPSLSFTSVIDTTSYTTLHQFTGEPKDVVFDNDGATAYIMDAALGALVPANTTTFSEGAPIIVTSPSSGDWFYLDKNPAADQIFVADGNDLIVVGDGPALADTGLEPDVMTTLAVTALAAIIGGGLLAARRRRL